MLGVHVRKDEHATCWWPGAHVHRDEHGLQHVFYPDASACGLVDEHGLQHVFWPDASAGGLVRTCTRAQFAVHWPVQAVSKLCFAAQQLAGLVEKIGLRNGMLKHFFLLLLLPMPSTRHGFTTAVATNAKHDARIHECCCHHLCCCQQSRHEAWSYECCCHHCQA
eukprot:1136713-Pelagomonas_calceolata.AAC.6